MGSKRTSRRELLKGGAALAGGLTLGAVAGAVALGAVRALGQTPASGQAPAHDHPMIMGSKELVAYGERSHFVTSVRIVHPMGGRPSPDAFGKVFHVASPLQDSVGVITPSSLHYVATTRGSYIPDIDPKQHTLMIHGLVDRPLTFTMEDLKRLPSVTRLHFIECAGNRHNGRQKTVQESHGMTSCAEWTGVLLSTLLKECGLKGSATWFVAEGAEEVKGASSMPIAKAMDDCIIAYGMNGEAVRPQQRVSAAADRPRLRGHLQHQVSASHQSRRPVLHELQRLRASRSGSEKTLRSASRSDPSRSSRTRPADSSCPAADSTRSAGWPGPAGAPFVPWRYPPMAGGSGTPPRSRGLHNAWRTPGSAIGGIGMETRPRFFRAAPTRSGRCNRRESRSPSTGTCLLIEITECLG